MTLALRLATPFIVLSLAACASTSPIRVAQAPMLTPAPVYVAPLGPSPAQSTKVALAATNVSNGFVDTAALALMTQKDATEANSAQFYALQFGRPGAPRRWSGDTGATGTVAVGPMVRVNNLDCREFTHTVTIGGHDYVKKGTACRENGTNWTVAANAA